MSLRRSIVAILALLFVSWSCSSPSQPTEPARALVVEDSSGGGASAAAAPNAVFRTRPADQDGTISGPGPLAVEFNLCQSRPASEDDDLKYTYDFDGDGQVDYFGHCRASHTYEGSPTGGRRCTPARVCVSDRRPGGEACRSYDVCAEGDGAPDVVRGETWSLVDVLFDDGTRASGSFAFDFTTKTVTDFNVTVQAGTLSALSYRSDTTRAVTVRFDPTIHEIFFFERVPPGAPGHALLLVPSGPLDGSRPLLPLLPTVSFEELEGLTVPYPFPRRSIVSGNLVLAR
jgi:hypothetical protein